MRLPINEIQVTYFRQAPNSAECAGPRVRLPTERDIKRVTSGAYFLAALIALSGCAPHDDISVGRQVLTAGAVHALFDLEVPEVGPFPSDKFTVPDDSQLTGRRADMPKPDCTVLVSDCEDIDIINTLDGFSLQPRLRISFDGAIDVSSVSSTNVLLVQYDEQGPPAAIGINQIVWEPTANRLYFESDESLDQHARFALIVTRGVLDASGSPVQASAAFRRFLHSGRGEYWHRL